MVDDLDRFIRGLPKAELHVHLEGSIERQLMLDLAARNGVVLRWRSAEELRAAFQFDDLRSFLDLYFAGCQVLVTRRDFYDITRAYLRRAHQDGVDPDRDVFWAAKLHRARSDPPGDDGRYSGCNGGW